MKIYDVAIIGGGASGCMAGIFASDNNKDVIIIEKNNQLGKKVLATGNGRCNLTNVNISSKNYHGANSDFVNQIVNQFNSKKTIDFFTSCGLKLKEESNGKIFPVSNNAQDVVNILDQQLKKKEVEILFDSQVKKISKNDNWIIALENGRKLKSKKLIISTGGLAASQLGSTGDAYDWLKSLGHTIKKTYPALVPLNSKTHWLTDVQGVKNTAKLTLFADDQQIKTITDDFIFTHFGISGPGPMALGRYVNSALENDQIVSLTIDLFPESSEKVLDKTLRTIFENNPTKSVKNCLTELVSNRIATTILKNLEIDFDINAAGISKVNRKRIISYLKNIKLNITSTRSFKEAQTTCGGINEAEINPTTLESKITPDLYFTGEVINVDGDCGGFNLQWAWSSGYVAGKNSN